MCGTIIDRCNLDLQPLPLWTHHTMLLAWCPSKIFFCASPQTWLTCKSGIWTRKAIVWSYSCLPFCLKILFFAVNNLCKGLPYLPKLGTAVINR